MTRVGRWERRAEVPLLLLAVAFLVAYAWPVVLMVVGIGLVGAVTASVVDVDGVTGATTAAARLSATSRRFP